MGSLLVQGQRRESSRNFQLLIHEPLGHFDDCSQLDLELS
jgi:hypothetical protein